MSYDAAHHYWLVGDTAGAANHIDVKRWKLFSSAVPGYVEDTDPAYLAWCEAGNAATRILDGGELADVLLQYQLTAAAAAAAPPVAKSKAGTRAIDAA